MEVVLPLNAWNINVSIHQNFHLGFCSRTFHILIWFGFEGVQKQHAGFI